MEWPSKNVAKGGIFHPPKVKFNPDTRDFLKLLMDESKMATSQRKKSEYNLRDYDSTKTPKRKTKSKYPKVTIRPGSSKRRSYESIARSGALEREKFVPKPIIDREAEKERLIQTMAFGKEVPKEKTKPTRPKKPKKITPLTRFDQLVQEIRDREDWMEEMKSLGQEKKYKDVIDQQIQEKIREMNQLDLDNISVSDKTSSPGTTSRISK